MILFQSQASVFFNLENLFLSFSHSPNEWTSEDNSIFQIVFSTCFSLFSLANFLFYLDPCNSTPFGVQFPFPVVHTLLEFAFLKCKSNHIVSNPTFKTFFISKDSQEKVQTSSWPYHLLLLLSKSTLSLIKLVTTPWLFHGLSLPLFFLCLFSCSLFPHHLSFSLLLVSSLWISLPLHAYCLMG